MSQIITKSPSIIETTDTEFVVFYQTVDGVDKVDFSTKAIANLSLVEGNSFIDIDDGGDIVYRIDINSLTSIRGKFVTVPFTALPPMSNPDTPGDYSDLIRGLFDYLLKNIYRGCCKPLGITVTGGLLVSVATYGDLPVLGSVGTLYLVEDTKTLWFWDGAAYVPTTNLLRFTDFSSFPVSGFEEFFYYDTLEEEMYVWDSVAAAYKSLCCDATQVVYKASQVAHGFSVGDCIYVSGDSTFALAQADSLATSYVAGFVIDVPDPDSFKYVTHGTVTVGVPAETGGTIMYLSETVAGGLTDTAPTSPDIVRPVMMVVDDGNQGIIFLSLVDPASGGGSGPSLEVNGTPNVDQTLLNLIAGTNITLTDDGLGGVTIDSADGDLLTLAATTVTERIDDWTPTGWPGAQLVKVILHTPNTPNKINIISGLSNGVAGRIITIRNMSVDNMIILENNSTSSLAANRFRLKNRGAHFLFPEETITLLHDGIEWQLFSGQPDNGHQIFDDFTATNSASVTTYSGPSGVGLATGASSNLRNATGNITSNSVGIITLDSGTAASGSATIKFNSRSTVGYSTGNNASKILLVSKLRLADNIPDVVDDYRIAVGMGLFPLNTGVDIAYSLTWFCDSTSGFWQTKSENNTGALTTITTSSLPVTNTDVIVLGVWYPNNLGDAVYFYSADGGMIYTVDNMFVRASSSYGGSPIIGIQKILGAGARKVNIDYIGFSKKGGII